MHPVIAAQTWWGRRCVRKTENPDFVTEDSFMGWEARERGTRYYTRSKWVDGRVVREYIGGGPLGEVAAQLDEYERRQREEEDLYWKEERERLERNAAFLPQLEEAADILVRAHLLGSGCHYYRGEWRRAREHYDA